MQRILIDTDPGVDDAFAILLAMRSPELRVEAITTVCGNAPVAQATQNLLTILGVLDLDVFPLIAQGEAEPLVKPLVTAAHVHGEDGLGNTSELRNADGNLLYPSVNTEVSSMSAVDLILEMATSYPDELVIVTLGPLTNIAKAIRKDASKMQQLQKIVVMGGVFEAYGNVTLTAEFNIFVDPHAAHEVFHFGVPVYIAPLDVTHQVILTGERLHAEVDKRESPISNFLKDSTHACMEFYRQHVGFWGFHIHDALPIGMLTHPDYFESVDAYVQVETAGTLTNGMTIADLRRERQPSNPNAHVCVKVAAEAFLDTFFERLQ
ncbi:nucleoside hydrolase [Candidatus Poribacteria bacterium]|nr:nucleoside hydrolase [Candidatus Poribacteria bacterium]MYB01289.1 nucleoside hydrolase [Candidatus Poribacteria bacterium]